jgi:signal peptidase II
MRLFFATAVCAVVADLLSKIIVVASIGPMDPPVRLLGGSIYLLQARNSGAAFSVGTSATVILTAISVVVVVVILRAAQRMTSKAWAMALGLVLGGAIGNLVDRFFRAPSPGRGHVVDWISLFSSDGHVWPIFNVADMVIVTGGAITVLLSVRGVDFNGNRDLVTDEASTAAEGANHKPSDVGSQVDRPSGVHRSERQASQAEAEAAVADARISKETSSDG